jgi:hypothetical protein
MAERVSCVWMASSRVGATTRTVTVDDVWLEHLGEVIRRARAGMPNASVLPLFLVMSVVYRHQNEPGNGPASLSDTDYIPALECMGPCTRLNRRRFLEIREAPSQVRGDV